MHLCTYIVEATEEYTCFANASSALSHKIVVSRFTFNGVTVKETGINIKSTKLCT